MAMLGPITDHYEIRAWAGAHDVVPIEVLPHIVDHEPLQLKLIRAVELKDSQRFQLISWDEFFSRFDILGLACVYDDKSTGNNELLQIENKSPYRNAKYAVGQTNN